MPNTMNITDGSATVSRIYTWKTTPVAMVAQPQWGTFLGFAARGYGAYRPGGNPVLQGPVRATEAEALADAADVTTTYTVTGYTCG